MTDVKYMEKTVVGVHTLFDYHFTIGNNININNKRADLLRAALINGAICDVEGGVM